MTMLRAITGQGKENNRRLPPHQSATSARTDSPQRMLETFYSSTEKNSLIDQLLCSWNIMATAREKGLKQLAPHIQIPTRSVHRMFRIRSHGSFSCRILHIHALTLAAQSLGESVTAISPSTLQIPGLFECHEVLFPMECVPEISLCLVPALNRGALR